MFNGLGNPNNDRFAAALYGQQPLQSGLNLKEPPKSAFSKKAFGKIVDGEIVSEKAVAPKNDDNHSNQKDTHDSLAYTHAYAAAVREQVRAKTSDGVARANMTDLNQPITQKQFLALNTKLDSIGNKLDQLLGSKAANTEQWNLQKASLIDNSIGNTELGMA